MVVLWARAASVALRGPCIAAPRGGLAWFGYLGLLCPALGRLCPDPCGRAPCLWHCSYDEDLWENPFFRLLRESHRKLFTLAEDNRWTVSRGRAAAGAPLLTH